MKKRLPRIEIAGESFDFEASADGMVTFLTDRDSMLRIVKAGSIGFFKSVEARGAFPQEDTDSNRMYLLGKLHSNMSLTDEDRVAVVGFLEEAFVASNAGHVRYGRHSVDGAMLFIFVTMLTAGGASLFRNELSEPNSACDMAAEAFQRLGWKPTSYSGVKNAFLKARKNPDFPWSKNPENKSTKTASALPKLLL